MLIAAAGCGERAEPPAPAVRSEPASAPAPVLPERDGLGPYRPAREAGGLVFLTGVTAPAGPDGRIGGDLENQTGAALRLLAEALEQEALDLSDVVRLRIYVAGNAEAEGLARALQRAFATRLQPEAPARSVIAVSGFPAHPGARVMLEATAARPDPAHSPLSLQALDDDAR